METLPQKKRAQRETNLQTEAEKAKKGGTCNSFAEYNDSLS